MPSFTEKDMIAALQMVADGATINQAAETCGIGRSALQSRVKGRITPKEAHKPRKNLSDIQERRLRDWILVQADLGCPVSQIQVISARLHSYIITTSWERSYHEIQRLCRL
jgi:hypothetical protein